MDEITTKEKKGLISTLIDNKEYIYPILFYLAGLIIGSIFYSNINLNDVFSALFQLNSENFLSLFINRFSIYISIFALTVLLGMCLIGFPFINLVPLFCGIEIGIKISYYYVTYSVKGIGYSLLMIIPESAIFLAVLVFTIKSSNELSKSIYDATTKKSDMTKEINLKSYLKKFLLYGVIVAGISSINALASYLLGSIINI
jgi:stage II sporulation protein M